MKSLLLSVCLLALSSFSSARCPGRGGLQDWEDQELFILANEIEEDDRGSQKLSWRHFDRSCDYDAQHTYRGGLGIYYYDSSDPVTGHTEFQMMRDRRFLEAADTPGYMFIWSTQAPCVFGSRASGREACSDAVPPFLAQFRRTKFIFGFSSRRFGRHEYRAMVLDGRDTDWNGFADILREKWGGSRNANLLAYDGDRSFRVNQWLELAFLERNAVVSFSAAERLFHLRNKLGKSERMSKALAEPASAPKDGSTDEVLPAHKKVLVHVVEGGKKFPLSFVLGKEDGTIVGQVAQGLAVPTPLPAGAMYIAIFANPFTDSVEQYFKLANSVASAGGRVNVVFVKTQPLVMPVAPAVLMDQQLKKTPLTKENLRLFALVGSTQVPKRIWPRKPQTPTPPPPPAAPGAPGAPKPPASPAATKGKGK